MKNVTLFLFVAALTACVSYSSRIVIGADPKKAAERPLALSGKAIVDGCEVTGQLVRKDDGVYAVLDAHNPTEKEATAQFNLAVHCTPASSPMMRMIPMPSMIHRQHIDCRLAAGESKKTEILVKKEKRPAVAANTANTTQLTANALQLPAAESTLQVPVKFSDLIGPPSWSLAISREEIKDAPGWGGSAPIIPRKPTVLDKGLMVLTRALLDEANGAS